MTDIDFNMMPLERARSRTWNNGREKTKAIATAQGLRVSVHVSMAALEADWRMLEASPSVSLHQSYDWCAAWATTHANQVLLVRGTLDGRTVFILPLELVRGPLFRTARFLGSPHSNINTGLFATDFDPASCQRMARALLDDLATKLSRVADIVTLEKMPFDWRGVRHPLASLPAVKNQNASYQLPLLGDFEKTLAQINAKRRRKKFRVSEKRLEAIGGYEHIVATTPQQRRATLELFLEQKAIRFKALGLPNVFKDRETQAFLHQLVSAEATEAGHLLQLHAIRLKGENEGRIVAIAGLSRKGDHVICQFGSIDESIAADASPGELLFYLMIRKCEEQGAALFDFGIGDQGYKRSWCTVETEQRDIVLPLTFRGRFAAETHRLLVRLKSLVKSNRQVYGFVQRIRQRRQTGKTAPLAEQADD